MKRAVAGLCLGMLVLWGPLSEGLEALAQSGVFQFRWKPDKEFQMLDYNVKSSEPEAKNKLLLKMDPLNGKVDGLRVSIPEAFHDNNGKIYADTILIKLDCSRSAGQLSKTTCASELPAEVVISEDLAFISILPERLIDPEENVAIELELVNPEMGIFQFNAFVREAGDSFHDYQGSWLFDVSPGLHSN